MLVVQSRHLRRKPVEGVHRLVEGTEEGTKRLRFAMSVIKSDRVKDAKRVIWPSFDREVGPRTMGRLYRQSGNGCYAAVPERPVRLVASGGRLVMPFDERPKLY